MGLPVKDVMQASSQMLQKQLYAIFTTPTGGIEAILAGAHAGGSAEEIEQQLFEVHEQIADNRELREALTPSRRTGTEARVRLAEGVFAPHISAPAMSLVDWCVRHHAEGGPLRNLRRVVELAAEIEEKILAALGIGEPGRKAREAEELAAAEAAVAAAAVPVESADTAATSAVKTARGRGKKATSTAKTSKSVKAPKEASADEADTIFGEEAGGF